MADISDEDIIEWAADLLMPYAGHHDFCLYQVEPYPHNKVDKPLFYFKFRYLGTVYTMATVYGQDKEQRTS